MTFPSIAAVLVPVAVTLLLFLIVNLLAVGVAYGKMKQWASSYEVAQVQRWSDFREEANRRWDRIEKKVGITNGGAAFMPREECASVHVGFQQEVEALDRQVKDGVEQGRVAIREGREDRDDIKRRLAHVEAMVERLAARGGA